MKKKYKDLWFYVLIVAIPTLQFLVFYIGVNFNSIVLAFKKYTPNEAGFYTELSFAKLDNFKTLFYNMKHDVIFGYSFRNSLICYLVGLLTATPLGLIFSYYIYKKNPAHNVFKIMLFLPSILSSIVLVLVFRYFADNCLPAAIRKITGLQMEGLISNTKTSFASVLFYCVWSGFGQAILLYSGAMNGISDSLVEAAQIDGITPVKEFLFITLPSIYSTIVTFLIVSVAGIFTNQMNLFSFFGTGAERPMYTVGYYLFRQANLAAVQEYPMLSAFGIVLTMIIIPATYLVKWLLEKFGPSVE